MKLLLITKRIPSAPAGGRELLCKLNRDCLADICGGALSILELDATSITSLGAVAGAMHGHIDGLSDSVIQDTIARVRKDGITDVFVDGSNLGAVIAALKESNPSTRLLTFFHNVESRFFLGALWQRMTPRAFAVVLVNYLAERKSVRFSDALIMLSARDSRLLKRIYGRPATFISPMALADKMPADETVAPVQPTSRFILFVGGDFYANRAGISWFVEHVMPRIRMHLCVVGKGMEALKSDLECNPGVEVVGAVDDLSDWYRRAHFVVAPIFDGSGMKTKVAEALMFGKRVVGSPEAFSGYEGDVERVGCVCATADEFVTAINRLEHEEIASFDAGLRTLFETTYSYEAARARLEHILLNDVRTHA